MPAPPCLLDHVWILSLLENFRPCSVKVPWTFIFTPTMYSLPVSYDLFVVEWCLSDVNSPRFTQEEGNYSMEYADACRTIRNRAETNVEHIFIYLAVQYISYEYLCKMSNTSSEACMKEIQFDELVPSASFPSSTIDLAGSGPVMTTRDEMQQLLWGFDIRAGRQLNKTEVTCFGDKNNSEVTVVVVDDDHDATTTAVDDSGTDYGDDGCKEAMRATLIGRFTEDTGSKRTMDLINSSCMPWPKGASEVPESRCSPECPDFHIRLSSFNRPSCCFTCLLCEGDFNYLSDAYGTMACQECGEGSWFNRSSRRCQPRTLDYLRWNSLPAFIFILISIVSVIINTIVLAIIIYHHSSPVVKAANRELSVLLLIGTAIGLATPILHLGMPSELQCKVHVGLQGPLTSLIVSTYLVKTKGVLSIFESNLPDLMHRHVFLHRHMQLLAVLFLVMIEIVAVILYLTLISPEVVYIDSNIPQVTYVECDYGIVALPLQWLYNWGIIVVTFVIAFRARHLPENFGESRLIALSMGCSLIVWFISFACFLLSHGSLKAIFQNCVLIICCWIFMAFLSLPKCYILLMQPHRNTVQELRRMTLAHVRKRTEEVWGSSGSRHINTSHNEVTSANDDIDVRDTSASSTNVTDDSISRMKVIVQIDSTFGSRDGPDGMGSSGQSESALLTDDASILNNTIHCDRHLNSSISNCSPSLSKSKNDKPEEIDQPLSSLVSKDPSTSQHVQSPSCWVRGFFGMLPAQQHADGWSRRRCYSFEEPLDSQSSGRICTN